MESGENSARTASEAEVSKPQWQPSASPKLSVIVPVYNGEKHISRCLEGLCHSEYRGFEVILVDDCSTDDTDQIVERYPVFRVRTPHTLGPAGARNMGIGYAAGKIVVFVDADVVLPPNALGIVAREFECDPELAALFGSYDDEPAWDDFFSQYKNLMHSYVHQKSSPRATTFWAGCGAVRKEIFIQIGGFDWNRYPKPSIEDIELGYRLVRGGQPIQLNKQLQVKHLKRWTLWNMIQTDIFSRAVPWTNLILETRTLPRDLNLSSGARFSAGLVGLLSMAWIILLLQVAKILPALDLPHTFVAELGVVTAVIVALIALNWDVYSYFASKRGWWFATRVVPFHWFYYLYSGVVFVTCGTAQMLRLLVISVLPSGSSSRTVSGSSRSR